jgi:hypothetical protein
VEGAALDDVAILVPLHTLTLTSEEQISFRHLRRYLGARDTYLVLPEGLAGTIDDLPARRFDARFFTSHRAHQRLMLDPRLYESFATYTFVLVYHLDSLVLSDELERWCGKAYDYVGAPWTTLDADGRVRFAGVGNGGFSLRRVSACLRALEAAHEPAARVQTGAQFAIATATRIARRAASGARDRRLGGAAAATLGALRDSYLYEDKFFGTVVPKLLDDFRVPAAEVAVSFAFETAPRYCYEQNGRRLPFGGHKWTAYDRAFWEPHLLHA